MFTTEWFIIFTAYAISLGSLLLIPKNKIRDALFIFLFTQLPSWIIGLWVTQNSWIEYPVRDFGKANQTSFAFEFLILPITAIHYNLFFPVKKRWWVKVLYSVIFVGSFTIMEIFAETFTNVIKYQGWTWYFTFLSMMALYYFIRIIYLWYFKTLKLKGARDNT